MEKKDTIQSDLKNARIAIGLYSISELCLMFGCSRYSIDNPINRNELKYISPNNKTRYVYLQDFLNYLENKKLEFQI